MIVCRFHAPTICDNWISWWAVQKGKRDSCSRTCGVQDRAPSIVGSRLVIAHWTTCSYDRCHCSYVCRFSQHRLCLRIYVYVCVCRVINQRIRDNKRLVCVSTTTSMPGSLAPKWKRVRRRCRSYLFCLSFHFSRLSVSARSSICCGQNHRQTGSRFLHHYVWLVSPQQESIHSSTTCLFPLPYY